MSTCTTSESQLVIWKYSLPITDEFELSMPEGANIIAFKEQYDAPAIWAVVDLSKPNVKRRFLLYGTGQPLKSTEVQQKYIGTVVTLDGALVWHLFELQ